ncbi:hypothetical protein [Sulfurovum riftiae]|uniref:Uncharacterized protein n=1 Tax=Sulfurovum riftiae TaxID=1630136 RepID=A0A151CJ17_9BACT|nr:hypothetical protein [Sulfurovum riftiae]KYJ87530.1 hypothetical protein AS592_10510 [Sulfurovum riftiae]
MNRDIHDHARQANHRLITQVASYYNEARENIAFYKEINCIELQELSRSHLLHWKEELRSLIFNGINHTDERSAS